jgi:hypothetical protein
MTDDYLQYAHEPADIEKILRDAGHHPPPESHEVRIASPEEFLLMRRREAEQMQAERTQALARLQAALEEAVKRVLDVSDVQLAALTMNIFLCFDDAGLGLYVKDQP